MTANAPAHVQKVMKENFASCWDVKANKPLPDSAISVNTFLSSLEKTFDWSNAQTNAKPAPVLKKCFSFFDLNISKKKFDVRLLPHHQLRTEITPMVMAQLPVGTMGMLLEQSRRYHTIPPPVMACVLTQQCLCRRTPRVSITLEGLPIVITVTS